MSRQAAAIVVAPAPKKPELDQRASKLFAQQDRLPETEGF
jgi:hypothetical protein